MLSRIPGCHAGRLLRLMPFDEFERLRTKEDLMHEIARLERLSEATLVRLEAL